MKTNGGDELGAGVNEAAVRHQSRGVTEPAGEKRLSPPPPAKKPLLSTRAREVFLICPYMGLKYEHWNDIMHFVEKRWKY